MFDFLKSPDINEGLTEFEASPNAVLLDVRMPEEYAQGHLPRSKSLPLNQMVTAKSVLPEEKTPLFVYCMSGARSKRAAAMLKRLGYENVTDIGGINSYLGAMER